jgi:integrase/recombinase XerD
MNILDETILLEGCVNGFISHCRYEKNLSPKTINGVKKIFDVLYKELSNNTKTENYTYLSQVRNIAIVELLFATEMRISELCNLKVSDIDLWMSGIFRIGWGIVLLPQLKYR